MNYILVFSNSAINSDIDSDIYSDIPNLSPNVNDDIQIIFQIYSHAMQRGGKPTLSAPQNLTLQFSKTLTLLSFQTNTHEYPSRQLYRPP